MSLTMSTRAGGIDLVLGATETVVELWGEVDATLRADASLALAGILDARSPIVIDASGVTFIDSAGVAFLVQLCTIGRSEGLELTLKNPPVTVADVLRKIGYGELIGGLGDIEDLVGSDLEIGTHAA